MHLTEWLGLLITAPVLAFSLKRIGTGWTLGAAVAAGGAVAYLALRLTILDPAQALSTSIFIVAYALIASERVHATTVAMAGAVAMVLVGLIDQKEAFHGAEAIAGVDWNTIFLLIGMMVVVNITRHTGLFEWLAIRSAKLVRGEPVAVIIMLSLVTAVLSAGLDNVTTVLLITPVALLMCETLAIAPTPVLIFVVLVSNIGGAATLIGDPPNIMIGSAAGLTFVDFLKVDGPVILVVLAAFLATVFVVMKDRFTVTPERRARVLAFDESKAITNRRLLRRCLAVIALTLAGFCLHGALHLEPATIALAGAVLMMLLHHDGPEEALREVEWPTIFFFIGLFIMVSALVKAGVIAMVGNGLVAATGGNPLAMTMLVLWFSAFASAIVGSVPFAATGTVLIHGIATTLHPEATGFFQAAHAPDVLPLWWALSLGCCLGGNFTIVGAAANLVVAGIAARSEQPIGFVRFMKYGVPITLQGLLISSVWLWFLYFR